MEEFLFVWNVPLFTLRGSSVRLSTLFLSALILILSFVFAKWAGKAISHLWFGRSHTSQSSFYGLGRVVHDGVVVLGFYIALGTLGIDLTGIAVLVGAVGVGVGFGLQVIFNNLAAGLLVLFERRIGVGDHIEFASGDIGMIVAIRVRNTLVRTLDQREIVLPNIHLISNQLINWSFGKKALYPISIAFSVGADADKEAVIECGLRATKAVPYTYLEKQVEVYLIKLEDGFFHFRMIVWVDIDERVKKGKGSYIGAYLSSLTSVFEKEGIPLSSLLCESKGLFAHYL